MSVKFMFYNFWSVEIQAAKQKGHIKRVIFLYCIDEINITLLYEETLAY